ncbi:MAG: hypothetical protein M0R46_00990 [Candidatus Muirbacterium halophilum]|nr:hypothetical protein [Candidatus Muirbacterium halophilum]MCK9474470.1 hypothetical protein [Candidatus Muirbacterium halophilum]
MKKYRCFSLYSGGLDSMISSHLMKSLGYEVILLTFRSEFFNKKSIPGKYNIKIGDFSFEQHIIEVTSEYIDILKKPKFGFGKNMNPCVDCKILFLSIAKNMMKDFNIDFLITGEVIGQRPKSQKSHPLKTILREADVKDILIRPLSLSHFPINKIEENKIINRNDIINIISVEGRGRFKQIEYANKNNIKDYSSPGGGCFLTYADYCRKLRPLINENNRDLIQYELLKTGRHFDISSNKLVLKKFIVGKNKEENQFIENQKSGIIIKLEEAIPGPLSILLYPAFNEDEWEIMSSIHLRYSDIDTEREYNFVIRNLYNNTKNIYKCNYNKQKGLELTEKFKL